jgi:hypothetical protein
MVQSAPSLLYVNPTSGNDSGTGAQNSPFKTITRALKQAASGTRIQLSTGTYQDTSGEIFPLVIPAGVVVVGNEATKGQGILIQGSGRTLSPTFAGQNITIRMENNAQLRGVTVTNPVSRGTAVWIESTNPVVANCTFTQCLREGVFATGTAKPTVIDNVAVQNSANGFSIVRDAKGEWRGNVCRDTGFGFAVGDNAAPLLIGNQLADNRAGVVVGGAARPVLRNNLLERCQQTGLVVLERALPDLGNTQDLAGNIFRSNTQFDIQNSTNLTVICVGNELDLQKLQGPIEIRQADGSVIPTPSPTPTPTPTPTPPGALNDIKGHWAEQFILGLVGQGYISGFPDGSFKPDAPLTRAQYAALIARTFDQNLIRPATNFIDVPPSFWAYNAIIKANRMGFISGFPDNSFRPDQNLTRVQAIVSLVNGLNFTGGVLDVLRYYRDRVPIPDYARDEVATATQRRMVVNYPLLTELNPMRDITRAEVSALIYQALVALSRLPALVSPYIVQVDVPPPLFTDITGHWAAEFIQGLGSQNLISGFEDGSFRPDIGINRAQYAALIVSAFNPTPLRDPIRFSDVPADYWARPAIEQAYRGGFISGFPDGTFKPNDSVLRLQVLLSLVSGLKISPGDVSTLSAYDDRNAIPPNAQDEVAAATKARLVVNHPNVRQLNPQRAATRAEVASMVYQGLVRSGRIAAVYSPYIVSV